MTPYKFLSLFFLLLFFSCEKEIEYKGEGKSPVLVLDAILETNAPPLIRLSRSVFFLSNNNNAVDAGISGATVKLYNVTDGLEYILTPGSSKGYYQGTENIKPNTVYRIEISHPDYVSISSEMTTVSEVELMSLDTMRVIEDFIIRYQNTFAFKDPAGSNFYSVMCTTEKEVTLFDFDSTIISIDTLNSIEYVSTVDPSFGFYKSNSMFFNDAFFENKLKTMMVEFIDYSYYGMSQQNKFLSKRVVLTHVSEGVFNYFKSIENNQPNGPFNDPTNVYTNVKNGLGIFGSFSSSELTK